MTPHPLRHSAAGDSGPPIRLGRHAPHSALSPDELWILLLVAAVLLGGIVRVF